MPLFGGPHRHGINYSTRTERKSPDRAKITQEKKVAPEPTRPPDISPPPDMNKRGEEARRGGGGTVAAERRSKAVISATAPEDKRDAGRIGKHAGAGGTHDEMRARRRTLRSTTRGTGRKGEEMRSEAIRRSE